MTLPKRIYKVKTLLTNSQHLTLSSLEAFDDATVVEWRDELRAPVVKLPNGERFTVNRDGTLTKRRV